MDQETLNLVNAVTGVLTAIGTIGAVGVALWLARRDEKLRLKIDVATGGMYVKSAAGTRSRFEIMISIANLGRRPAQITSVEWRLGYYTQKRLWQVFDPDPDAQRPPTKLSDGEFVIYVVPIAGFNKEFPAHIMSLPPFEQKFASRSIRLVVNTTGKSFVVKVNPTLRAHLEKLMQERPEGGPSAGP